MNKRLFLLLCVLSIVFITACTPKNASDTITDVPSTVDSFTSDSSEASTNNTTDNPAVNDNKSEEFKNKAQKIEEYDSTHYQIATTQSDMNRESKNVYDKWDALLNEVYQYLKTTKSESEFSAIQADEIKWISEKETAVNNAAADFEGGSMEPMVRNTTAADYTKNRCYYLISLID